MIQNAPGRRRLQDPALRRLRAAAALSGFASLAAALLLAAGPAGARPAAATWRTPDPATLLVIDTTRGRIVVELQGRLAPLSVERVGVLARGGVYDGLLFHRVIDGFVDQTGNPDNRDGGASDLANLPPEFDARAPLDMIVPAARPQGALLGFLGSLPVEASNRIGPRGEVRTWGIYCQGVMGMGRQAAPDTANSEIFFMRAPARRLDHEYAAVGRVLVGQDVVDAMAPGVPPPRPDRMLRVRLASDLPASDRPRLRVLDERSAAFAAEVGRARRRLGADFTPCAVDPTVTLLKRKDLLP